MRKLLIALAAAGILVGMTALPAAAWHVHASGSAACQLDGTYMVSWSYTSSNAGEVVTWSQPNPTILPGTTVGTVSNTAYAVWDHGTADPHDDEHATDTASVQLDGTCPPTNVQHHPSINGTAVCNLEVLGTYDVRFQVDTDGAVSVDGAPVDDPVYAGTFPITGATTFHYSDGPDVVLNYSVSITTACPSPSPSPSQSPSPTGSPSVLPAHGNNGGGTAFTGPSTDVIGLATVVGVLTVLALLALAGSRVAVRRRR